MSTSFSQPHPTINSANTKVNSFLPTNPIQPNNGIWIGRVVGSTEKSLNIMTPPPPSSTTTTYTTIPISAGDVISRSLQNFTSSFSLLRPWPELFTSGSFTRPVSFSSAWTRLRASFHYFRANYSIIISAFGALSLIGSPISLLMFALMLSLWLLLYFFREDPLVLWGYALSDRLVLMGLVLVSVLGVCLSGSAWNLVWGVLIGFFVCGVHAVLRNSDGSLVPGEEAALIGSGYVSGSYGAVSVPAI